MKNKKNIADEARKNIDKAIKIVDDLIASLNDEDKNGVGGDIDLELKYLPKNVYNKNMTIKFKGVAS